MTSYFQQPLKTLEERIKDIPINEMDVTLLNVARVYYIRIMEETKDQSHYGVLAKINEI